MELEAVREYTQHVEDFRRTYLMRVLALLAIAAWPVGMGVLLLSRSPASVVLLATLEGLCWLSHRLYRGRTVWLARQLVIAGLYAWWVALVWTVRDPALLFVGALIPPLAVAVLDAWEAVLYALLIAGTQLVTAALLVPAAWLTWQILLAPFLMAFATGMALLWNLNLSQILTWALHSTRTAVERLEEVQEHRGQLQKSMSELDATCRRLERANEMLAQARAEAETARHARNQFAMTVSHELRTPLSFIIGFSELMVNSPGTYGNLETWPPGLYEDIQEIYHSSNHLVRLVNDILDLGRAEAQRLMLLKEWIAPRDIAQEAVQIMHSAISERRLTLEISAEPDLPNIFVDRTRIRQVLINLISNALRFTEHGGITIGLTQNSDGVLFAVHDTGIGIPPDEIAKVFETFGQANMSVWRRRGGSGLGVPISRRFVELHGGRMWLESQVDQGTTFFFNLPLPGASSEATGQVSPEEDDFWTFAIGQPKAPKPLLVLSPDPHAGKLMAPYLEPFRVVSTTEAALAGEQLITMLPHALIVDEQIASETEVSALLQNLPYDLPVLTLRVPGSSMAPPVLPPGVQAYLLKPVLRNSLVQAIEDLDRDVQHLLVVDDDPAMARFVSMTLAAAGYHGPAGQPIDLAARCNGREALDYLSATTNGNRPDLILLDLGLPDISGWDVLTALQAQPDGRDIPVILVTAASLPEELDSRERRVLQISTRRPLTQGELTRALSGLLQSIPPKFPADGGVLMQPASPAA